MDLKLVEQIAYNLAPPTGDVAFLVDGRRVLFSHFVEGCEGFVASSAAMQLIQGIYGREPLMARKTVRNRIFSTESPGEMCLGMVRVAAKRITGGIVAHDHGLFLDQTFEKFEAVSGVRGLGFNPDFCAFATEDHLGWMKFALEAVAQTKRVEQKYLSDRPVAAVLVSAEGELLEWAVNSGASNRTFHAEVNLVQSYCARTRQRLPKGARVYTTLKCCKMCAGMIWEAATDPAELRVYFWDDDPGSNARVTVFNRTGLSIERCLKIF